MFAGASGGEQLIATRSLRFALARAISCLRANSYARSGDALITAAEASGSARATGDARPAPAPYRSRPAAYSRNECWIAPSKCLCAARARASPSGGARCERSTAPKGRSSNATGRTNRPTRSTIRRLKRGSDEIAHDGLAKGAGMDKRAVLVGAELRLNQKLCRCRAHREMRFDPDAPTLAPHLVTLFQLVARA